MRLAFLFRDNPDTTFNGISTFARELTKELRKRHEVEWFIGGTDRKTLYLGAEIPNRFDLVYCLALPYGANVRLPMVAKVNSPLKEEARYYSGLKRLKGFIGQFYEAETLNRAKAVVSVSKVSHDILKEKYSAASLIIPDGVDLEKFKPVKNGEDVSVMVCYRRDPRKNFPLMERALEYLEGKTLRYVATGEWPPNILEQSFRRADIFLTTSFSEGFNQTLLQAMASGCAVLASDIPAHRELIDDGGNGVLFKGETEMKTWLDKLIQDKQMRAILGSNARKKAEQYPWSRTAEETEKVFEYALFG